VTTTRDHGSNKQEMIRCPENSTSLYPSLALALRDLREANGRDEETGDRPGNFTWIALSMGMVVLDSLTPSNEQVGTRWMDLLTGHGIDPEDATIIYQLRCSLLHGYGLPKPSAVFNRRAMMTREQDVYAVDTDRPSKALISVPVFCSRLVERIAFEAPYDWDTSLITRTHQSDRSVLPPKISAATQHDPESNDGWDPVQNYRRWERRASAIA